MDKDALKNPRELYKENEFWLVIFAVFALSMFLTKDLLTSGVVAALGASLPLVIGLIPKMFQGFAVEKKAQEEFGEGILLGEIDGKPIRLVLESLNHAFIIGMTRYGKTRLVYALISEFILGYRPDEVKLAFSDAKAVSFNVFARSQHLFAPIANSEEETEGLINLVLTEMNRRKAVFQEYHEKICTNVDEYYDLSGERLPRIVVIFDEVADSVEMNSIAEKNLTTLAKMGLAYGIHLVLITQRPTNKGISHEITSQCQTVMSTYMKNAIEYGSVAKIPQEVYSKMRPIKGRFMVFSPDLAPLFQSISMEDKGWGFLTSKYMDNKTVERIALADSTSNLDLPSLGSSIPSWQGSEEDKLDAMKELEDTLGKVTVGDMKKYFGVGGRTARTWLEKYYGNV